MIAFRHLVAGMLALTALPVTAQVSLDELPALARARSERQRPAQEAKLEPYWGALKVDYEDPKVLEAKIAEVARLGDSVVPLLLEKLTPADDSSASAFLATNSMRVLRQLEPSTFFDALVELVDGRSNTARRHALELLGYTSAAKTAPVIVALLPRLREPERIKALEALGRLRAADVAANVVPMLGDKSAKIRRAVLDFLIAARPTDVVEVVLQALEGEYEHRLLPRYVTFLGLCAQGRGDAAQALLPLLDGERLDWADTRTLVRVLGGVAPAGHKPTMEAMRQIITSGDTGSLGLAAGLTLHDLGDKAGLEKLHQNLNDQVRRSKRDASLYYQRANLYFALEKWRDAIADFDRARQLTDNSILKRNALLRIIRSEAHRHSWSNVLRRFREGSFDREAVLQLSREDPAILEALQKDKIREWFNGLPRDG